MLPLWVRLDLKAIAVREYTTLPKAPSSLEPHHHIVVQPHTYTRRKHNQTWFTNFNERTNQPTHFFIKICISHTLFSKGLMFLWCVRDGWRQGQTAILTQLLLLTIARCVIFRNPLSTSSASWLELLNRGSQRATASWLSLWSSCDKLTQLLPAPAYILS